MKRARVAYLGAVHDAVEEDASLRLADGRLVSESVVVWLPPLATTTRPRTIFAVEINYTDYGKELAFKAPDEPLVFVKGPATLVGHRGETRRPADATYMHYACELAVVIGKTARRVTRTDAYDYVQGYTVANDYMVRDYLEDYYPPSLRAASRDAGTPLGPWLVDASDVRDPMNLRLRTLINGGIAQQGSTRDMVFDIRFLIAYLSAFMTLFAGDVILTGTPNGLAGVHEGDEVVTEIDGIGRLSNTIVGESSILYAGGTRSG
ncbi:MAG: fumarylacetoacetate hydrolase family protein [Pseudomonadota bacterium]|nr:fumarylacetoacetate hydrolase family protein [Pseudomonadota bacterium]